MIVRLLSPAEEEFGEAAKYYENERQGLGEEFILEVRRAADIVADFPKIGTPAGSSHRSFVIRRFPYSLIYWSDPDEIVIAAIAHHSRRPGYWKARIS